MKPKYTIKSSLGITAPKSRLKSDGRMSPFEWIDERKEIDGAEGLWRIHNNLYDFNNFLKHHPGGSVWLEITKGTDITEAFESHHLSDLPEGLLHKYFVKKAVTKRNVPYTFAEDGFYKVLKKEVIQTLKTIPKPMYNTSDMYSDILFVGLVTFSLLAVRYRSFGSAVVAGFLLGLLTTAAHNYIHRKDSFRMYYFQFSLFQVRDWRISHVLSHHLYPNTILDLETSMPEPFLQYHPVKKPLGGYISAIMFPFLWFLSFPGDFIRRLTQKNMVKFKGLTGLLLPALMYLFGAGSLLDAVVMWIVILVAGSFEFTVIGLNAAHHHPDIFHDGDTPRSTDSYDWGLVQLDAVMERSDIKGSDFLVLTCFGDHALHHLFPTLDHSVLKHLYPTLEKVMIKFDIHLRYMTQFKAIVGGFQQLVRVDPNPLPPDLNNKKYLLS